MTIPTIAELRGNTILQLFADGYNKLRKVLLGKQNTLVAGDNIVIDEETNRISAIVGGTPVLDDYYTKSQTDTEISNATSDFYTKSETYDKTEVDTELLTKADVADVYTKEQVYTDLEVDALLSDKADISTTYSKTEVDTLLSAKATADNVYTKAQTDSLLSVKADSSGVYTKTQTDNLLTAKADSSNVYTKTETNTLLNAKANNSDVYTKAETNTLLNAKANSTSVYTKSETDALLSAKANTSNTYTKSEVYTKAETNAQIQAQPVYNGIFKVKPAFTISTVGKGRILTPTDFTFEDEDLLIMLVSASSDNSTCSYVSFSIPWFKNQANNMWCGTSYQANAGHSEVGLEVDKNLGINSEIRFYLYNGSSTESITDFTIHSLYVLRKVTT